MPNQVYAGQEVVALVGGPGTRKTSAIVGRKGKGIKLGQTHQGYHCLMSVLEWAEVEPLAAVHDGEVDADKCRVVLMGHDGTIAYPWSYDGHHNMPGYQHHLRELLGRGYNAVVLDSLFTSNVGVLGELIYRGAKVTLVLAEADQSDCIEALVGRASRDTKQKKTNSPIEWATRNLPDLPALLNIGVTAEGPVESRFITKALLDHFVRTGVILAWEVTP